MADREVTREEGTYRGRSKSAVLAKLTAMHAAGDISADDLKAAQERVLAGDGLQGAIVSGRAEQGHRNRSGWVIALAVVALMAAALLVTYLAGVRVFVIQPIGAIPDGVTVIVSGVPGLQLVDSPDAMCQREQGGVSLLCRASAAGAVAQNGNILLRLPYSEFLLKLSGAPNLER